MRRASRSTYFGLLPPMMHVVCLSRLLLGGLSLLSLFDRDSMMPLRVSGSLRRPSSIGNLLSIV